MTDNLTKWDNYLLESRMMIGRRGRGSKVHRVSAQYVVGVVDEALELSKQHATIGQRFIRTRVPQLFSAHARCNGNGQRTAHSLEAYDITKITCDSCAGRARAATS